MKIGLIIEREYMQRVGKKTFILTTILMPLLIVAMSILPTLVIMWSDSGQSEVLVLDQSGQIAGALQDDESVKFIPSSEPLDSALAHEDMVLLIPETAVSAAKTELKLYTDGPSSMDTEKAITRQVQDIIETIRLDQRNLADLQQILAEVKPNISVANLRTDRDGEQAADTGMSFAIGMVMAFMLYMFVVIYGQMIMTSIIEEKNNRVLELVVSSVKPSDLMLGKIFGVSLVALTQIVIWGIILVCTVSFILPAFLTPEVMATFDNPASIKSLLSAGFVAGLMGKLTLFLITGFLFYAAIYAAIGSAVDNIQDASQLQILSLVPILIGLILAVQAVTDPNSTLALVASLVPFTSPMVMVARLPFDVPAWQGWVSLAILVVSVWIMAWIAGKIYRVGIFMYGKKPSVKEIIHWLNYK